MGMLNQEAAGNAGTVHCEADPGFRDWMASFSGSVVFSTRRSGKICFLGWDGSMVTLLQRAMDMPTGLKTMRNQLLIASKNEISLYADAQPLAYEYDRERPGAYDACYLPRTLWFVGDVGVGDVLTDREGILFVNTRFSCVSRPSFKFHFEVVWKPEFITDVMPDDRCHLSGAEVVDGRLAYVTAFAPSNDPLGWRSRMNQGILMDARSNQILLEGLAMPHSPRWYKECLWFLNSAAGELCVMNPENSEVKIVRRLPGITRGLAFWGNYAVVGLSKIVKNNENREFPLWRKNQNTICGVILVNILTGREEGTFLFENGCDEIFDLELLPGIHRAALLPPENPRCFSALTSEKYCWWMHDEK